MPAARSAGSVSALGVLILAAGKGVRMRSSRVKLLHSLGGAPMVCHVARAAWQLRPRVLAAVVGSQAGEVTEALESLGARGLRFVTQKQQLGTGHAVLQAERLLRKMRAGSGTLLILNGDVPLIRPETLRALVNHHRKTGAAATALTTKVANPAGYGRVLRGSHGFEGVAEEKDASEEQKAIQEINAGLYCVEAAKAFSALRRTGRANAQREYYLPDLFPILRGDGERIEAYVHPDAEEVLGINDRAELAAAGRTLFRRKAGELMAAGVTLIDPDQTYIEPEVQVGQDTIISPMVQIQGRTRIGAGCRIGALVRIVDSTLGNQVTVRDMCVIMESRLANGSTVGPFTHLRPGSVLEQDVHVGNFTEVKKSRLGRGSKANHLSYLGDATIGAGCNIGAGTITCNYDGVAKHPTILEDGVFIGSDTQLVAPVKVRRGAYVGAGSTITKDVPAGALALTRAPQRNIEGWVARTRKSKPPGKSRPRGKAAHRRRR